MANNDTVIASFSTSIPMEKNPNFEEFLNISGTSNPPDLWGLPSWWLALYWWKTFRFPAISLLVYKFMWGPFIFMNISHSFYDANKSDTA